MTTPRSIINIIAKTDGQQWVLTCNACGYADLAMTEIDHKILNHDDRPKDLVFPADWSRFRDDCF